MYRLKPGVKQDPVRRWALPDRIFFGLGACHILAGVWLKEIALPGFRAEQIIPAEGHAGSHIFVTDRQVAFDFHGYCSREKLLAHHERSWSMQSPGWSCSIATVDFDLLDTAALNARKMRGPDQYLYDVIPRARRFLQRYDHAARASSGYHTEQPR